AADDAADAKTAADQAVVDAQAAIDALPDTATEEEKAAAATALTEAQATAAAADEAKAAADAKAAEAMDARDDERVAVLRALEQAKKATEAALADKVAADEALAKAKEEAAEEGDDDACVPEAKLTTVVTGLPSTVVAGTKVNFNLRVTNGTNKTMDEVFPFAYVHATDRSGLNGIDDLVHLQWSSDASSKWKTVDNEHYMDAISPLKAGAHADIKMRLTIDASAPAGNGVTFVTGDYFNDNGTCGGNPELQGYEFLIAAAGSTPGKVDDAKPSETKPHTTTPDVKPQSAAAAVPVSGTLAATGSSSAMSQLALASGAALAIGAGAVFVVRRREARSQG
ncbi:MAG TPA: peptidase, partial [Streptomyces sp.]